MSGDKQGRRRVVIQDVRPQVSCGRFAVKRVVGDTIRVEADAFADGHEAVRMRVQVYAPGAGADSWPYAPAAEVDMEALGNDKWAASFAVDTQGLHHYRVCGWVDTFRTWAEGLKKKIDAEMDIETDLLIGSGLVEEAAKRAGRAGGKTHAKALKTLVKNMTASGVSQESRAQEVLAPEAVELVESFPDRSQQTVSPTFPLRVDRQRAAFSAWYEMFPRSARSAIKAEGKSVPRSHGTFADVIDRLPYVADMGFDVLYLPPIHPIGETKRKGKNNALEAGPDDPGVPWAIGSKDGGHKAIHPDLGTLDEFRKLVAAAEKIDVEIALDIAFQCSPDHPWVTEHPSWFVHRPDGSVQYAENPPKKYEDIYPLDFDTPDWEELWTELKSVFDHWIRQGVKMFRVDNPHTKSFPFWEWAIDAIKSEHPDVLFLAEAFTRPKRMYGLAMAGFSQSYTYFTWRNTAAEMRAYGEEVFSPPVSEYFRPNFWPNTPDILHEDLQTGGRAAFMARFAMAATLAGNYGIYGPAFELMKHVPRSKGSEEYLNSEKYEIKSWDLDAPDSLAPFIKTINMARRDLSAFHPGSTLRFHDTDNPQLLCYSRTAPVGNKGRPEDDPVLVVVNFDYHYAQSGWVEFSLPRIGVQRAASFVVTDLLTGDEYTWDNAWNFVRLDPESASVHLFRVQLP